MYSCILYTDLQEQKGHALLQKIKTILLWRCLFCGVGFFLSLRTGSGPKAERTEKLDMTLEALPVDDGGTGLVILLLEIHMDWKVESEARMEPPIQTEYFLSGGAMILIFMVLGARAVISFCIRSAIPGYMVEPPDRTTLAYRSFLMSTSHFMMEL